MKPLPILVGFLLAGVLALCGQRFGEAMPQVVKGGGALSVAFGDARETISRAMVHKADSYFHGGIDMECSLDHDHECGDEECHHEHHHHKAEGGAQPESNNQTIKQSNNGFPDPWRWINAHIRAPEIERHLEKEKVVELMPWFWAAVKADPHNVDAWTTALYMASHGMKDDKLSQEVIRQAKLNNPDSLEILLEEGRFVYKRGEGNVAAAERIFCSVRDMALARCDNNPDLLPEHDRWMYRFALNYLNSIKKRNKGGVSAAQ